MRRSIAIMVALLGIASPGCERSGIRGSGVARTELRDVGDFGEVEFLGVGRLEIRTGRPSPLEITADDNLLPLLRTDVQGHRLVIRPIEEIRPRSGIVIKATVPKLKLLSCAGNPEAIVEDPKSDVFSIVIKGNGKVVVNGETGHLKISVTGHGNVRAEELVAQTVDTTITGNGYVVTHAGLQFNVKAVSAVVISCMRQWRTRSNWPK